jgi:hypothetical protein
MFRGCSPQIETPDGRPQFRPRSAGTPGNRAARLVLILSGRFLLPKGGRRAAELKVLRELVEHHVDEEEGTGFSCARHDFGKDELEAMAQRFQTRKAQLMTRVAA